MYNATMVDTSKISSLGCGCIVQNGFFPSSILDLEKIFERHRPCLIAGGLTNSLFLSADGYDVLFSDGFSSVGMKGDLIEVGGGVTTAKAVRFALENSLSGMENLFGLPGTVGGGVFGNAGCFGTSFADIVDSVLVFRTDTGETEELDKNEIAFGYRYSNLRKNTDFIYKVRLKLVGGDKKSVAERTRQVRKLRSTVFPHEKSLGCVFKNTDELSAGYLIERSGMKGQSVGGMSVSKLHADFIVNNGFGTAEEYKELAERTEEAVLRTFGIRLKREVRFFDART